MPSSYDGPNSSGVGDNAFGRMGGMGGMGRRGSGMTGRQMRQYSQLRRDEMSHGAWLQNQNNALAFNRDSSRIDANVQQADWTAERGIDQGKRYADAVPHATSADLINKKFGYDPRFAPDKPTDTGTPPPPPPGGTPPPPGGTGTPPVRKSRVTKREVEDAVRKGFYTAEEANDDGEGKPLNAAYTRAYARSAASSPDKTARGRQFQGPQKGGTPAGQGAVNYDSAPKSPPPVF